MRYEGYLYHDDGCIVYAAEGRQRDVSVLRRRADGSWHCGACDTTGCRHADAAAAVAADALAQNGAGSDQATVIPPRGDGSTVVDRSMRSTRLSGWE